MVPRKPEDILAESFRIIDKEVGRHSFDICEWLIVQRMIHASGDVELASLVHFHNDPVTAGYNALARHTPIVTDVTMVLAGINEVSAKTLGVPLHCFLNEPGVEKEALARGTTRSAQGFERAMVQMKDAVYVIGNAPTALLALCAAVRENRFKPALIVALPVGFVAVTESKEEALRLPVPVITLRGRKGGSAVAAATVNALMLLAIQGNQL